MTRRQRRRDQQRAPEADIGRDRVGDIAADDEKSAMGEIDDVAQVEDERQAERHQHIERADDQPVGDVEEQQLGHGTLDGLWVEEAYETDHATVGPKAVKVFAFGLKLF